MQNVLVIMVDDLRTELGAYGSPVAITPNMDRLAREGATFDNAYVSFAACTPSRMSFLTGRRPTPADLELRDRYTVNSTFRDGVTLPDLFKANNFTTASFGKVYHYPEDDADGWSTRIDTVEFDFLDGQGFRNEDGSQNTATFRWKNGRPLPDETNVALAKQELKSLASEPTPFFMAVGIHRPHLPWIAPDSDWAKYSPATLPRTVNPNGQNGAPGYAMPINSEFSGIQDLKGYGNTIPPNVAQTLRWGYMASVSFADRMVGDLLDGLEEAGLDDNTAVILWGDHGFRLGDNGRWGKWSVHSLDVRVPLIMRIPTVTTPGRRVRAMVETVDIYPTLARMMDLAPPDTVEGVSVLPLFERAAADWKRAAFSFTVRPRTTGALVGESVNADRYRYTVWTDPAGNTLARELYDKELDRDESTNRIEDRDYAEVVGWLETLRQRGWRGVQKGL